MTDPGLAARLDEVSARAARAARASGRSAEELSIIPVTKFQPESLIRELYALGIREFAENRHQEAREKAAALSDLPGITWHFVGQLQTKKARQVRDYARVIQSVDRPALVDALASDTVSTRVFLQVNLTLDDARGGAAPHDVPYLAERVLAAAGLELCGVMAVAPLEGQPRAAFARLRAVSDVVRSLAPEATAISAGMSGDFEEAVLEGATHLRIGTAITGIRPPRG